MSIQTPEKGRAGEWSAGTQGMTDTPTTRTSEPTMLAARLAKLEAVIYGRDESEQLDTSPVTMDTSGTDASLEDRLAHLEDMVAARAQKPKGRGKRHSSQLADYLNGDRRRALTRHREKKAQKPDWAHSAVDKLCVQARSKADRKQTDEEERQKQEEAAVSPLPTVVDVTRLAVPGVPRGPGLPLPSQLAGRPGTDRSTSPYPRCSSPYPRSGKSPTPRQEVELRRMGYHQCRPDMRSTPARKRCYTPGHSSRDTSIAHGQGWGRPVPPPGISHTELRDLKKRHVFLSPHRDLVEGASPRLSLMQRTYAARVPAPVPAPTRRSRSCPAWTPDLNSHVKTVSGLADSGEHCSSQRALREMTKRHRVSRDVML